MKGLDPTAPAPRGGAFSLLKSGTFSVPVDIFASRDRDAPPGGEGRGGAWDRARAATRSLRVRVLAARHRGGAKRSTSTIASGSNPRGPAEATRALRRGFAALPAAVRPSPADPGDRPPRRRNRPHPATTDNSPWGKSGEPSSARSADRGGVRGGGVVPLPANDGGGNRAAIRAAGPWEGRSARKPDGDSASSGRGAEGGALFPRADKGRRPRCRRPDSAYTPLMIVRRGARRVVGGRKPVPVHGKPRIGGAFGGTPGDRPAPFRRR